MRGEILARLFVIVGGIIVLALTAALVAPYFVDWTSYRADFEREASRILGRAVKVEGAASARLLPFPSVTFGDVRIAGAAPGETAMTIEEFSMDAELAPFMRGEILIFDMRIVRPRGMVRIGGDGAIDWALRPSARFDPAQVRLERVTVSDGALSVVHEPSGRTHLVSEMEAEISARSLAGPWRLDGSMRIDGARTALAVSTGTPDDSGAMRLRVRAALQAYPLELETDGSVSLTRGRASYSGNFRLGAGFGDQQRLRAADAATFAREALRGAPRTADHRFSGGFVVDHRRLDVTEFRLETGPASDPYTAQGVALLDYGGSPRFLVEATGAQVRLDDPDTHAGGDRAGMPLAERLEAFAGALESLPRPTIEGRVKVDLPAIVAGDTTIRNITMSAEPAENGWLVDGLRANFPGRTTFEAKGFLSVGAAPGFKGRMLVAVGQPSGFAAWLARDVDDAIRRLPSAGFSADVDLAPGRQRLDRLELILGGSRFTGSLDRRSRTGGRPSMLARLDGGALDLESMTAFASLFVGDGGQARFGGHDVSLDLKAGPVDFDDLTAEAVDAALRLKADRLEVDRLSVDGLAGASISATATIEDMAGDLDASFDVSVLSVDLEPFVRTIAARFADNGLARYARARVDAYPGLLANARVDLIGSLMRKDRSRDLALSAQGRFGEAEFTLAGSAGGEGGDLARAPVTLDFSARSGDMAELLALFGLPALDLGLTGEGEASLALSGVPADGVRTTLSLADADASARFEGTAVAGEKGLTGNGRLTLDGRDFEPWLMTLGAAVPGMGIGTPAAVEGQVSFGAGRIDLGGLRGNLAGIPLSGDLAVATDGEVPHVTGRVSIEVLDVSLLAMMLLGDQAFEGDGQNWPGMPFVQSGHAPVTADVELDVASLDFGVAAAADDVRMTARIDRDGMRLSDVSGRIFGGEGKALIELGNNEGTGLFSSQIEVRGADIALLAPGSGLAGSADVTATLTGNGKSTSAVISALAGSGTVLVHDLVLPGLDPSAFGAIIAEADRVGRDIDAEATAGFAPDLVSGGRFAVPETGFAFTVASGVVRAPPLLIEGEGAWISAAPRLDLTTMEVTAEGELTYEAGEEALVGSEPKVGFAVSGPLAYAGMRLDTGPLAQFLTQRALEIEQARVEAMQAVLLQDQRLRREARYYEARADARREAAEQARQSAEEEARRMLDKEALRKERAEEAARLRAEEEARRAEAEARRAEEERRAALEAEARRRAEEEARRREEAERKAEAERRSAEASRQSDEAIRREPLPPIFDPRSIERFLDSLGSE